MDTRYSQSVSVLLVFTAVLAFVTPVCAFAQGNNQKIYNDILGQYNHPSQKNWKRDQAEAPMIDVDAIVRREEEERRRRQQANQPQQRSPTQAACREGEKLSDTGCGTYGIHPCFCVNGTAQWR